MVEKKLRDVSKRVRHPDFEAMPNRQERFRVPPSLSRPKRVFVNCHYCGYSPPGGVIPQSGICPKCGRSSWDRFALPEPLVPKHMK